MRISEIISESVEQVVTETINSAILDKRFKHKQKIGNYTYTATADEFLDDPLLYIKAYDGDKQIGEVMFQIIVRSPGGRRKPSADYLESGGTEVNPKYRNKGIASTMYAYAKMLGNDIIPSDNQWSDGKAMWAAWKKSGDDKHLIGTASESVMAEDETGDHQFKTAYHITLREDAKHILKVGLKPTDGLIYLIVDDGDKAKLKREISRVGMWMYAKTEGIDDPLVLLKVNIEGIPLEKSNGWYVTTQTIAPSRITSKGELAI